MKKFLLTLWYPSCMSYPNDAAVLATIFWRTPTIWFSSWQYLLSKRTHLVFMESLSLDLPLLLKAVNHVLVAPANLMQETLGKSCFSCRQSSYKNIPWPCSICDPASTSAPRYDYPLLPVIWWQHTFKKLETFQSSSSMGGFVRNHASYDNEAGKESL